MSAKLPELAAFSSVASHLSFQKAARERGVSRSAISHSVASLERTLGLRLLHRDTRSVTLTDAGLVLSQRIGRAFGEIDDALSHIDRFRETPMGRLRVCALRSVAASVVGPVIAKLTQEHPGLSVEVILDDGEDHLVADGFDAAVRFLDQTGDDMIAVKLRRRYAIAVVAAPAQLTARAIRTPEDLRGRSCIRRRGPAGDAPWVFERDGERLRLAVDGPIVLESDDMMIEAALAGAGPAYVFEELARPHLDSGRLVRVLEDWMPPAADLYVCYPSRRQPSMSLKALVSALRAA